jgi:hypothetical protein
MSKISGSLVIIIIIILNILTTVFDPIKVLGWLLKVSFFTEYIPVKPA